MFLNELKRATCLMKCLCDTICLLKIALFISSSDVVQPGWNLAYLRSINSTQMQFKNVLKIHDVWSAKHGESDYEGVVKVDEGFNGADLRNVYTESGMSVIRTQLDYVKKPESKIIIQEAKSIVEQMTAKMGTL